MDRADIILGLLFAGAASVAPTVPELAYMYKENDPYFWAAAAPYGFMALMLLLIFSD